VAGNAVGRARIAVAAVIAVALAGPAAYVLHRQDQANKIAALNQACQDSYTAEVAKTQRVAQLPQSLGAPLIELQRGDAQFRLYTSAPGPLRAMTFDCARMADGSVSGRLSFGSATPAVLGQPMIAYQDYLPDGSTAVVVQMRDSSGVGVGCSGEPGCSSGATRWHGGRVGPTRGLGRRDAERGRRFTKPGP
jgi:hypothetical protein